MASSLTFEKFDGKFAQNLKKYFTNVTRTGYIKCGGFTLPEYFQHFGDKIRQMEIRPQDTWVCSMPKSGTTWTQEMVWCIANDVDLKSAQAFLPQRFPMIDHTPLLDTRKLVAKRPELEFPEFILDSVSYINNLASPRFIKSHLPFSLLPEKLQRNETTAKIVYVVRNPRDTCISYYHHCRLLEGFKGDFEDFCELFLNGAICYTPYWEHVSSYWRQRNNGNMLIIRYEEMKKDLRRVIIKTGAFLGKSLTEEQIVKLMDHLAFENMKRNRAVNYEPVVELYKKHDLGLTEEDGSFMRCGQVGQWKETMSPFLIKQFEEWDLRYMNNADYHFISDF